MTSPEIESKPIREKLLPQTSIRFLFVLMTLSALMILLLQASASSAAFWTKLLVLVLATVAVSFAFYALMFLLAGILAKTTGPLVDALESSANQAASVQASGEHASSSPPISSAHSAEHESRTL